ncbi:MAG: dicarboxylate transporter/tellurite-resistance protein TehA [Actinomycetota bacterium]
MKSRVPVIPASLFGIVLGLIALGDCWRAAHFAWETSTAIPDAIMVVAEVVWAVLLLLFAAKWVLHRDAARAEIDHPVQSSFVSLISVSTLLISYLVDEKSHHAAVVIFAIALIGAAAYGANFTARLRRGELDPTTLTPAVYLPTVAANLVASFAAAFLGFHSLAVLLFGAGLLSWLMLESQIGFRLAFTTSLPPGLRPTMGILLAPPSVACMAYLFITGGPKGPKPDNVVLGLIGYGLFILLVLIRDLRWLLKQPFNTSYWAFSFGIGALAFDIVLARARGMNGFFDWMAKAGLAVATLVIVALAIATLWQLVTGRLLKSPATAAATS